jgi:hypothetical protein
MAAIGPIVTRSRIVWQEGSEGSKVTRVVVREVIPPRGERCDPARLPAPREAPRRE